MPDTIPSSSYHHLQPPPALDTTSTTSTTTAKGHQDPAMGVAGAVSMPDPTTADINMNVDAPSVSNDADAASSPTSAVVAATTATANAANGTTGVNKRYRPAPAKTFQCRGYGECRMVFSRSEHLARHIRWVLHPVFISFSSSVVFVLDDQPR